MAERFLAAAEDVAPGAWGTMSVVSGRFEGRARMRLRFPGVVEVDIEGTTSVGPASSILSVPPEFRPTQPTVLPVRGSAGAATITLTDASTMTSPSGMPAGSLSVRSFYPI